MQTPWVPSCLKTHFEDNPGLEKENGNEPGHSEKSEMKIAAGVEDVYIIGACHQNALRYLLSLDRLYQFTTLTAALSVSGRSEGLASSSHPPVSFILPDPTFVIV